MRRCKTVSMNTGSWLQRHPRFLELLYGATAVVVRILHPLIRLIGYRRSSRLIRPLERVAKEAMFGCKMCGQCVLQSTGMTCPMTCPKELRNGACGGVRPNGNCEVIPDMKCVWVLAYERSRDMPRFGHQIVEITPPLDHRLVNDSAWVNWLDRSDQSVPVAWSSISPVAPEQESQSEA
jgi:hypothetical protein